MNSLEPKVVSAFQSQFGTAPSYVGGSPGRVNLIGEHTDYNDGFVLPAAINFGTMVAARPRNDSVINVLALDYEAEPKVFPLAELESMACEGWAAYVRGVILALQNSEYRNGTLVGADLVVSGDVPQGAGLSSSASFEVALLKCFSSVSDLDLSGEHAALIGQKAENVYVGCACGIMDQLVSALGKKDRAMLLDCRSLETKHSPIPAGLNVMIINSNVKRGLVESEYNARREQCEQAAKAMGVASLRDASMDLLNACKEKLSEKQFARAHHVITENERTLKMFDAMGKSDVAECSRLMKGSHVSMRDDFEITVDQIDYLVELVDGIIGESGGVRMTGGGFGGCVVALVPDEKVDEVTTAIEEQYEAKTGIKESIFICSAENGGFTA